MPDEFMDAMAKQRLDDKITEYFMNTTFRSTWDAPAFDPLTDIYNAMQATTSELILRSPNKDDVYVITTLQPRSDNGNKSPQEG